MWGEPCISKYLASPSPVRITIIVCDFFPWRDVLDGKQTEIRPSIHAYDFHFAVWADMIILSEPSSLAASTLRYAKHNYTLYGHRIIHHIALKSMDTNRHLAYHKRRPLKLNSEENLECNMVQFQPAFMFSFIYDISSLLNKKISFINGPLAKHSST